MAVADVVAPFPCQQLVATPSGKVYNADNKGFIRSIASAADLTSLIGQGCTYADSGIFGAYILETTADGVAALGTTQAGAYQIVAQQTRISSATAGTAIGVSLPLSTSYIGLEITLINDTLVPITVFAPTGDTINDTTGTTGITQMPDSMCIYTCTASGKWYATGIGTGFAPTGVNIETASAIDALTAAGTTAATALQLSNQLNRVTTNSGTPAGVTLPIAKPGLQCVVMNSTATALVIYGNTTNSDQINVSGTTAASYTLAAGKTIQFFSTVQAVWHGLLSN